MTAAKPILDMMRVFSQHVVIANAEGCVAEAQARFQKSTEESLKKIFAVLIEHPEVKDIEGVKNWDINHVQLTDPLKSIWSENLPMLEETLAIAKQMATFVDQRDKCFQIATGTVFEKAYSKVAGGKELKDEKQKARQFFAFYTSKTNIHLVYVHFFVCTLVHTDSISACQDRHLHLVHITIGTLVYTKCRTWKKCTSVLTFGHGLSKTMKKSKRTSSLRTHSIFFFFFT